METILAAGAASFAGFLIGHCFISKKKTKTNRLSVNRFPLKNRPNLRYVQMPVNRARAPHLPPSLQIGNSHEHINPHNATRIFPTSTRYVAPSVRPSRTRSRANSSFNKDQGTVAGGGNPGCGGISSYPFRVDSRSLSRSTNPLPTVSDEAVLNYGLLPHLRHTAQHEVAVLRPKTKGDSTVPLFSRKAQPYLMSRDGDARFRRPVEYQSKLQNRADVYSVGESVTNKLSEFEALAESQRHKLIQQKVEADLEKQKQVEQIAQLQRLYAQAQSDNVQLSKSYQVGITEMQHNAAMVESRLQNQFYELLEAEYAKLQEQHEKAWCYVVHQSHAFDEQLAAVSSYAQSIGEERNAAMIEQGGNYDAAKKSVEESQHSLTEQNRGRVNEAHDNLELGEHVTQNVSANSFCENHAGHDNAEATVVSVAGVAHFQPTSENIGVDKSHVGVLGKSRHEHVINRSDELSFGKIIVPPPLDVGEIVFNEFICF